MDMGFTREHCYDALLHTSSMEQATDYILTHPPPAPAPAVSIFLKISTFSVSLLRIWTVIDSCTHNQIKFDNTLHM